MPSGRAVRCGSAFRVLGRPQVPMGLLAVTLFFPGSSSCSRTCPPFLETVTRLDVPTISLLLISGAAALLGTVLIGAVLRGRLYNLLIVMPLVMAALAVLLAVLGSAPIVVGILLALWGLVGTAAPVAWWLWLSRVLPDEAEAGGALMVAVVQLAITLGAAGGGVHYDWSGFPQHLHGERGHAVRLGPGRVVGLAGGAAVVAPHGVAARIIHQLGSLPTREATPCNQIGAPQSTGAAREGPFSRAGPSRRFVILNACVESSAARRR
ncbi:MFS transporter [Deinococcus yavapaiensis]|nr:MFS transporter [Deinococcus yavapaiensis]